MPHTTVAATRRYAAEFAGTALLVCAGCASSIVANTSHAFGIGIIALAFGLVVALLIIALGTTSGAHINPAVTLAFWSVRRFPAREVLPYIVAQCAGATAGAVILRAWFGDASTFGASVPTVSALSALAIEAVYSAILAGVIIVLATKDHLSHAIPPIVIGITVFVGAYLTGPITGGSFNPARSLGPALVSGVWTAHWIFWIAPIAGMCGAMRLHQWLMHVRTSAVIATGCDGPL